MRSIGFFYVIILIMKKVYEAEILDDEIKKRAQEKEEEIMETVDGFKKWIIFKGISAVFFPVLIFLSVIAGIGWLIMYVIDTHPYDYIVLGIFLFLIFSPIYKLIKFFKLK